MHMNTYHLEKTKKNLWTKVEAAAFGYNWQVLATSIAQETPPRNPSMLEYMPRPRKLIYLLIIVRIYYPTTYTAS